MLFLIGAIMLSGREHGSLSGNVPDTPLRRYSMFSTGLGVIFLVVVFLFMAIKILNEYKRGVIFRLQKIGI